MRVAFVIGHHKNAKGAYSDFFKQKEYDFYTEVMQHLEKKIGKQSIFHHTPNILGYTKRVKSTANRLNKYPFDLVIELHFNAATPQANGCETLYYFNSKKSKEFAKEFTKTVVDFTGIKSRNGGIKALSNKKDRGFASVFYPKAPTILIEPFFGTNEKDCMRIHSTSSMACILEDFLTKINKNG